MSLTGFFPQANKRGERLGKINGILQQLLKEGSLTEENAVNNVNKLLNLVRDCNVTVRWLMLHTAPLTPGTVWLNFNVIGILSSNLFLIRIFFSFPSFQKSFQKIRKLKF
jgi:hypothetical protein